jgi:hypothetical protein
LRRGMTGPVEPPCGERVDRLLPGKQPALRARRPPPRAPQLEQAIGKHDLAILAALACSEPDVGDFEAFDDADTAFLRPRCELADRLVRPNCFPRKREGLAVAD